MACNSKSLVRLVRSSVSRISGYEAPPAPNPPEKRETDPTFPPPHSNLDVARMHYSRIVQYDRSGRSSGVAVITFETPAEATRAKKQFDGILCKSSSPSFGSVPTSRANVSVHSGQPMAVAYDTAPPKGANARRGGSSLMDRIEKLPLLDRIGKNDSKAKAAAPS